MFRKAKLKVSEYQIESTRPVQQNHRYFLPKSISLEQKHNIYHKVKQIGKTIKGEKERRIRNVKYVLSASTINRFKWPTFQVLPRYHKYYNPYTARRQLRFPTKKIGAKSIKAQEMSERREKRRWNECHGGISHY